MSQSKIAQIDSFVSFTGTSRQIAEKFLVSAKWIINDAMNNFYDQGAPMPVPEVIKSTPEVENFFTQNAVNHTNETKILDQAGLQKLFSSVLGIDMQNPVIGHIMINVMQMKKAGEATKQNLYNLLGYVKSKSFQDCKLHIQQLEHEFRNSEECFKRMYLGFFQFYSVTKTPTLDFDIAVQIWETYFKNRFPFYNEFMEFLNMKSLQKKICKVHKDLWQLTYEFMKTVKSVNDYSESEGWPLMIDDFVTYLKAKNGQ